MPPKKQTNKVNTSIIRPPNTPAQMEKALAKLRPFESNIKLPKKSTQKVNPKIIRL